MPESSSPFLTAWSNFYIMTGSAAAALTGLMFVVITLVTGRERARSQDGISTFSTPTVMHFAAVLLVSAVLCAPWHRLLGGEISVGVIGVYGVGYVVRILLRARNLSGYTADLEDWTWYIALPFVAYCAVAGGAIGLHFAPVTAFFAIGLGVVLLLFIGIRNAWDVVTFLATGGAGPPSSGAPSSGP
jgi:hypothetical protein